jgi:hypothetical protein
MQLPNNCIPVLIADKQYVLSAGMGLVMKSWTGKDVSGFPLMPLSNLGREVCGLHYA